VEEELSYGQPLEAAIGPRATVGSEALAIPELEMNKKSD
jgi:hypothetical protein